MTGDPLDLAAAEACGERTDGDGNCAHPAHDDFNPCLGEFEADAIRSYDPSIYAKLDAAGIPTIRVEIEDFDLVGKLIDEVKDHYPIKLGDKHDFLYKHAISKRISGTLISISGSTFDQRNKKCADIFGHGMHFYED